MILYACVSWTCALSYFSIYICLSDYASGPAPRGAFRGRAPQITASASRATIVPQKKTKLGATGVVFGICAPPPSQNTACALQPWVKFCSRTKNTNKGAPKTFFVSTPEFVDKNWDPHHKISSLPARLWTCPPSPQARLCPRKEANGPEPRGEIWGEDRLVFFCLHSRHFEKKLFVPPKYFFLPPPPVTLLWCRDSNACDFVVPQFEVICNYSNLQYYCNFRSAIFKIYYSVNDTNHFLFRISYYFCYFLQKIRDHHTLLTAGNCYNSVGVNEIMRQKIICSNNRHNQLISFHTLIAILFAEFSPFVYLKILKQAQLKKFCWYNEYKNFQYLEARAAVEDYYFVFRYFPP